MKRTIATISIIAVLLSGCSSSAVDSEINMQKSTINIASSSDTAEVPPSNEELPLITSSAVVEPEAPSSTPEPPSTPVTVVSSAPSAVSSEAPPAVSSEAPVTSSELPKEEESSKEETLEPEATNTSNNSNNANELVNNDGEIRAIWISYLDFYTLARDKSEAQFTSNVRAAFEEYKDYGLNTVFLQVRPYADALYESDIVPYSHTLNSDREEGQDPGYDLLEIMIEEARALGFTVEAWLNPYRIRSGNTNVPLSSDNPAKKMLNDGSRAVIEYNGIISFNPASDIAQEHIVEVIEEIIRNYDVDGIHFDDYFYPTTDMAFDSKDYSAYKSAGGTKSQADWRRDNVSELLEEVYDAIKSYDSSIVFGISPQANNDNNYHGQFVDVEPMINEGGYFDYICPQIYFGFDNETLPFDTTLDFWNDMVSGTSVDLLVGLGPYKSGLVDEWAGSGRNEWINNTDITARMVEYSRGASDYEGFAIFRSELFFNPPSAQASHMNKERNNLEDVLD